MQVWHIWKEKEGGRLGTGSISDNITISKKFNQGSRESSD
jgi:hypothetical protein